MDGGGAGEERTFAAKLFLEVVMELGSTRSFTRYDWQVFPPEKKLRSSRPAKLCTKLLQASDSSLSIG